MTWIPFSLIDVQRLDDAYAQSNVEKRFLCKTISLSCIDREVVATNGNRYDVNLRERKRMPVYWDDQPNEIRRSKWFYLPEEESRYIPYDEQMNELLEVSRKKKSSID